ncbi:MAG: hypothetical protein ACPGUD_11325 [Parashewanella sp.]
MAALNTPTYFTQLAKQNYSELEKNQEVEVSVKIKFGQKHHFRIRLEGETLCIESRIVNWHSSKGEWQTEDRSSATAQAMLTFATRSTTFPTRYRAQYLQQDHADDLVQALSTYEDDSRTQIETLAHLSLTSLDGFEPLLPQLRGYLVESPTKCFEIFEQLPVVEVRKIITDDLIRTHPAQCVHLISNLDANKGADLFNALPESGKQILLNTLLENPIILGNGSAFIDNEAENDVEDTFDIIDAKGRLPSFLTEAFGAFPVQTLCLVEASKRVELLSMLPVTVVVRHFKEKNTELVSQLPIYWHPDELVSVDESAPAGVEESFLVLSDDIEFIPTDNTAKTNLFIKVVHEMTADELRTLLNSLDKPRQDELIFAITLSDFDKEKLAVVGECSESSKFLLSLCSSNDNSVAQKAFLALFNVKFKDDVFKIEVDRAEVILRSIKNGSDDGVKTGACTVLAECTTDAHKSKLVHYLAMLTLPDDIDDAEELPECADFQVALSHLKDLTLLQNMFESLEGRKAAAAYKAVLSRGAEQQISMLCQMTAQQLQDLSVGLTTAELVDLLKQCEPELFADFILRAKPNALREVFEELSSNCSDRYPMLVQHFVPKLTDEQLIIIFTLKVYRINQLVKHLEVSEGARLLSLAITRDAAQEMSIDRGELATYQISRAILDNPKCTPKELLGHVNFDKLLDVVCYDNEAGFTCDLYREIDKPQKIQLLSHLVSVNIQMFNELLSKNEDAVSLCLQQEELIEPALQCLQQKHLSEVSEQVWERHPQHLKVYFSIDSIERLVTEDRTEARDILCRLPITYLATVGEQLIDGDKVQVFIELACCLPAEKTADLLLALPASERAVVLQTEREKSTVDAATATKELFKEKYESDRDGEAEPLAQLVSQLSLLTDEALKPLLSQLLQDKEYHYLQFFFCLQMTEDAIRIFNLLTREQQTLLLKHRYEDYDIVRHVMPMRSATTKAIVKEYSSLPQSIQVELTRRDILWLKQALFGEYPQMEGNAAHESIQLRLPTELETEMPTILQSIRVTDTLTRFSTLSHQGTLRRERLSSASELAKRLQEMELEDAASVVMACQPNEICQLLLELPQDKGLAIANAIYLNIKPMLDAQISNQDQFQRQQSQQECILCAIPPMFLIEVMQEQSGNIEQLARFINYSLRNFAKNRMPTTLQIAAMSDLAANLSEEELHRVLPLIDNNPGFLFILRHLQGTDSEQSVTTKYHALESSLKQHLWAHTSPEYLQLFVDFTNEAEVTKFLECSYDALARRIESVADLQLQVKLLQRLSPIKQAQVFARSDLDIMYPVFRELFVKDEKFAKMMLNMELDEIGLNKYMEMFEGQQYLSVITQLFDLLSFESIVTILANNNKLEDDSHKRNEFIKFTLKGMTDTSKQQKCYEEFPQYQ